MKIALKTIALLLVLMPSLAIAAGKVVIAKGVSDIEQGQMAKAYKIALENAKRAAVEQAVGTIIESRTIVENFQLVNDQVLTSASGRLNNYQVIKEEQTQFNTYEITIQAEADVDKLLEEVDRFRKALGWQKKPRVTVLIDQASRNNNSVVAENVKNLFIEKLQDNDFPVYELSEGTKVRGGFVLSLNMAVSSKETDYQGMSLTVNELAVNGRLTRADDARVLATASEAGNLPGGNLNRAVNKAAGKMVNSIWEQMRKKLIKAWENEQYVAREMVLKVHDLQSLSQAKQVLKSIKSTLAGVKSIRMDEFDKKETQFSITYRGWPEQFVEELNSNLFISRHFKSDVLRVAGGEVVIKTNLDI